MLNMITRNRFAALATGVLGLSAAMPVAGADGTVTGNATVAQVCVFSSNTATVNIKNTATNIDPSQSGPATGSGTFKYRCTSGVTPSFSGALTSIGLVNGANTMTATIAYTPATIEAGTGMAISQEKTRTIDASISQTEYENKPAGLYTKDYVITMTP